MKNVEERQMGENRQNGRQGKLKEEKGMGRREKREESERRRKEKVEESKGRLDGGEWIEREEDKRGEK